MNQHADTDYSVLDRPEVLMFLFHPRKEGSGFSPVPPDCDVLIPVREDISVGARFHMTAPDAVNLIFFHGNGEIVSDYDDLGPIFNKIGLNFLAVDYRGYGRSGGTPTVQSMMSDGHKVLAFTKRWLAEKKYGGPIVIMGRSLGSASALELASNHPDEIDGLIVESGFAEAAPLLRLLGIDPARIGFREEDGFRNLDKICRVPKPTLIIHAEYDHIIALENGIALYEASPAKQKTFLKIPGANHNDIFLRGMPAYLEAVKALADLLMENPDL
jgi:fermentation-respiration switch protein FrsA (DUF1100 family)